MNGTIFSARTPDQSGSATILRDQPMSNTAPVTPFGAHVARVCGYVGVSAAVIAAIVWPVHELVPKSFDDDDSILWLCLILIPLGLAVWLPRRLKPRSARGAQGILLLQSALMGLAFGMAFLPLAPASLASVFAVVAVSFDALGLWTIARRDAPSAIIMVVVVGLVGFGFATTLLAALWPDGTAYLMFAFGLGTMPQDAEASGGLEWITSVCCIIMFSVINAAVLTRTRRSFAPPIDSEAAALLATRDARGLYAYFLLAVLIVIRGARMRRR
jgi:FtsH-binding integral membrane protein